MKAVQLVAPWALEETILPDPPEPGPGEVLVRLRAIGLCGSDLHWYRDGAIGHVRATYPMVLGHEPVGEVLAADRGVASHRPGQRVAIEPSITCGQCEYCLAGQHNNCIRCVFMGGPQAPGFLREMAVLPARNAEPVPDGLTDVQATLIEPLAVIVHVMELVSIPVGACVAVLGAGPIGMLCAIMARLSGAARVYIADRVAHRVRLARELDVDLAIDTSAESLVDTVLDASAGRGADVVLDAAAAPETINGGLAICRAGGQFVLVGLPAERLFAVDLHTAMAKEVRIQTIKRSNHRGAQAVHLLLAGRIPEALITHRLPLEQAPGAFEMLAGYRDGVGKVVIEIPS